MGEQAHTAGPWFNDGCKIFRRGHPPGEDTDRTFLVVDLKPGTGESVFKTEANAKLIVRAVNSHADMLAALKVFLGKDDRFQVAVGGNPLAVDKMLDGISALITQAEGR